MANCGNNTLILGRITNTDAARISCGGCANDGPFACPKDIGPRKRREATRESIKDYVLLKLGAPTLQIELDQQQLDCAVDEALAIYEEYAPRDYFDFYVFAASPGRSVYQMPPDVGIVRNVFYKQTPQFAFQATDLDGAIPIEYFYPGGAYASIQGGLIDPVQPIWGRMGEWTNYKLAEQLFTNISSATGGWEWVGDHGHIKLYPTPYVATRVIVQYLQKCKDWGASNMAMREGALAIAMQMLGEVRSKYQGTYGPSNSGMQLNGESLVQRGKEMYDKWMENLIYKYGDILPITMK